MQKSSKLGSSNDDRYVVGRSEKEALQKAVEEYGLERGEFDVVQGLLGFMFQFTVFLNLIYFIFSII